MKTLILLALTLASSFALAQPLVGNIQGCYQASKSDLNFVVYRQNGGVTGLMYDNNHNRSHPDVLIFMEVDEKVEGVLLHAINPDVVLKVNSDGSGEIEGDVPGTTLRLKCTTNASLIRQKRDMLIKPSI